MTSPQQHWLAKRLLEILEPVPPNTAIEALTSLVTLAGFEHSTQERLITLLDRFNPKSEVSAVAREVHRLRLPDARSFLATLLEQIGVPSLERTEIMASLRLYTPLNQLVVHCPFKGCGQLSEPGLLFCPEHLHEAALLDSERARTHGTLRHCAFRGTNDNGSIGCSIVFRSLDSKLCAAHRAPLAPPPGPGASIHVLPISSAPKRSSKKKKASKRS